MRRVGEQGQGLTYGGRDAVQQRQLEGLPHCHRRRRGRSKCLKRKSEMCTGVNAPRRCSPANLTVRKIRDEGSSPPSVQAPVDADRYQGVVTHWYSPLSLDESKQLASVERLLSVGDSFAALRSNVLGIWRHSSWKEQIWLELSEDIQMLHG